MMKRYRIVIDGGSTGSRIHVFEYVIEDRAPVFDFGDKNGLGSMRISPGLSTFAEDPEGVGESLLELLTFARKRVPKKEWGKTEVRLMATAGLRMLDSCLHELILESCRNVLRGSGFEFRDGWASVISGSDEGVYAWVVANYALGTLGGDPEETTGIIELGGASAQVTFVSREPIPAEFSQKVKFGKLSYNLYRHNLLHFDQNIAFDLLQESIVANGTRFGRIGYANKVNNIPLDWALGAFILQSCNGMDVDHHLDSTNSVFGFFFDFVRFVSLFFFLLLFAAYFVSKWRKPEMKTIYDLEKAREVSHYSSS